MHTNAIFPILALVAGVFASPVTVQRRACHPWSLSCVGNAITLCTGNGEQQTILECGGGCLTTELGSGGSTAMCAPTTTVTFG